MSTRYFYSAATTFVQGCVEQPNTLIQVSESGLETLTFSFRGEPDKIKTLLAIFKSGSVPPIEGNWSNFRIIEGRETQNDGVWSTAEYMAKGLRGSPPDANVTWTRTFKSLQKARYLGQLYNVLYYYSPTCTIRRCALIGDGNLSKPEPSSPDFPGGLAVELETSAGLVQVIAVTTDGGSNFRACTAFTFSEVGLYHEIEEVHEIIVPQPPAPSE